MRKIYLALFITFFCLNALNLKAQVPNCAGFDSTLVFLHSGAGIEVYDPALPLSPTNPSAYMAVPIQMGGLAISYNLNGGAASPTFYTNSGGTYSYYNGAGWTNTGHAVPVVNPGGGVNYIFNKDGGTGDIWRYDGTGNATFLNTVSGGAGPYDLAVDQADNYYHLETYISPGRIIKYNSSGVPIDTFIVMGNPIQTAGGGFAMIGNMVFCIFNNNPSFYSGPIIGDTVNLVAVGNMSASDLATCPSVPATSLPPLPPVADFTISNYTICAGSCVQFTDISTNAPTAWTWTFPSGIPATSILQNPGTVCFSTPGVYPVELIAANAGGADTITKLLTVLPVPVASVTADDTEICEGESAVLTATPSGMTYMWDNGSSQESITVSPAVNTTYTVVVSQNICADTATISIQVWPFAAGAIMNDTIICNGDPVKLWVSGGNGLYQWYPVPNLSCEFCPDPVANAIGVNTYNAILLDVHGCQDTLSVRVESHPPFNLILHNNDTTIYQGDYVQLKASGAPFYYWTPTTYLSYTQSNSPLATPYEDITYTVTGVSLMQGCPQTDSVRIKVIQQDVVLPNAFSPNGDGNNDVFRVTARKFINVQEFKIFNRWGTELFSTSDITKGWDGNYKGKPQDPDVYFYMVRVAYPNGKTQFLRGDLTLIR